MALFACILGCSKGRSMEDRMSESAFDDDDDDDLSPPTRQAKSESPIADSANRPPIPLVTREPTANQTPSAGEIGVGVPSNGHASGGIGGRGLSDIGPDFGSDLEDG